IDPVCGMTVEPDEAAGSTTYRGTTYYFCAVSCLERFQADPESFLRPPEYRSAEAPPPGATVEYTCPMHPEIVRNQPGGCPICGMALEPRTVTLDEGPNPELVDMTRRFWIAAALSMPAFATAMADMVGGHAVAAWLGMQQANLIGLLFATPVV